MVLLPISLKNINKRTKRVKIICKLYMANIWVPKCFKKLSTDW